MRSQLYHDDKYIHSDHLIIKVYIAYIFYCIFRIIWVFRESKVNYVIKYQFTFRNYIMILLKIDHNLYKIDRNI